MKHLLILDQDTSNQKVLSNETLQKYRLRVGTESVKQIQNKEEQAACKGSSVFVTHENEELCTCSSEDKKKDEFQCNCLMSYGDPMGLEKGTLALVEIV